VKNILGIVVTVNLTYTVVVKRCDYQYGSTGYEVPVWKKLLNLAKLLV